MAVSHRVLDEISLELGRRTAARLRQQPALLLIARNNLARWSSRNAGAPSLLRCYAEWSALLDHPIEDICTILTEDNDEAQRLRQNSPFAGVLSAGEVWEVKQRLRHATTTT